MVDKVYPEWVQKHKVKGTSVRKVGNNYYLYKHSSKRVPGKKNPVPSDTYIGRITPEGIIKSGKKKVDANESEIIVKEYGFSAAIQSLCPREWKDPLGEKWQEVLDYIIVRESPESYITGERKVVDVKNGESAEIGVFDVAVPAVDKPAKYLRKTNKLVVG